mmetsp:Transcript_55835/g.110927  ORF Transcript_55835/g.110927 Transcript_55835/m.110927 type:complete len:233 (-) Transcript_55835:350-1048(-)
MIWQQPPKTKAKTERPARAKQDVCRCSISNTSASWNVTHTDTAVPITCPATLDAKEMKSSFQKKKMKQTMRSKKSTVCKIAKKTKTVPWGQIGSRRATTGGSFALGWAEKLPAAGTDASPSEPSLRRALQARALLVLSPVPLLDESSESPMPPPKPHHSSATCTMCTPPSPLGAVESTWAASRRWLGAASQSLSLDDDDRPIMACQSRSLCIKGTAVVCGSTAAFDVSLADA